VSASSMTNTRPTFSTFNREALATLQKRDVPRVRASDYLSKNADADATTDEELACWDTYLAQFAKLTDAVCLCCGVSLRCPLGMGVLGGFVWGLEHGEGHCALCRYPMRGHHQVKDLGTIRNLFLAYHPSTLSFSAAVEEP